MDKSELLLRVLREKQQLKEMVEEFLFDRDITNLVNAIRKRQGRRNRSASDGRVR